MLGSIHREYSRNVLRKSILRAYSCGLEEHQAYNNQFCTKNQECTHLVFSRKSDFLYLACLRCWKICVVSWEEVQEKPDKGEALFSRSFCWLPFQYFGTNPKRAGPFLLLLNPTIHGLQHLLNNKRLLELSKVTKIAIFIFDFNQPK